MRWGSNHACISVTHLAINISGRNANYDFDRMIDNINQRLESTDFIQPITYVRQQPKMIEAIDQLGLLNAYTSESAFEIDHHIDEPFFQKFNSPTGILEGLERIRVENYQVENNLGLTTTTSFVDEMGNTREMTLPKRTIGLNDIMNNDTIVGSAGVPSFTEMFQSQFEQLQALDDAFLDMSFDNYVSLLIRRGNINHRPDHWLNGLSTVLDMVGIVSIVAVFTGENFITGEILTDAERDAAVFNAVLNVGILGISILTAGAGAKAHGVRAVATASGKALVRDVVSSMVGGTAGLVTAGVLDEFGAPTWLQIASAMGVSYFVGAQTSRTLDARLNQRPMNLGPVVDDFRGFNFDGFDANNIDSSFRNLNTNVNTINLPEGTWNQGPVARGNTIHTATGNNLGHNFPTIDRMDNGVIISTKSRDLSAPSYQNGRTLENVIIRDIDSVANFQGTNRPIGGIEINASDITGRQLQVVVPDVPLSDVQIQAINNAIAHGNNNGVTVIITVGR